jgi:demethylmenaquinone methyltransferase/2-methoxy-6-polyprenyl-1,4-benzoquinol methylase
MSDDRFLQEKLIRYYRERAPEYDEWFLRQGRYDRGEDHRRRWFGEVDEVREELRALEPYGDVLEYACGTGIWTEELVKYADHITAIDTAREAIALNRDRLQSPKVKYVIADLFKWNSERNYDFVFFGFWITHVPPSRFAEFWNLVAQALRPGGRAFFVDNRYYRESTARDHSLAGAADGVVERRLNDGRTFPVIKVFYDAAELERRLNDLGWTGKIVETNEFFIYGTLQRAGVTGRHRK